MTETIEKKVERIRNVIRDNPNRNAVRDDDVLTLCDWIDEQPKKKAAPKKETAKAKSDK